MKIGGYTFLQQSRDHTSGLDKKAPEGKQSITPLDLEKIVEHRQKLNSSESKRAQVQTYLENIKKSREQLYHLQKEDEILKNTQNRLITDREALSGEQSNKLHVESSAADVRDDLSAFYPINEESRPEISTVIKELERLLDPDENSDLSKVESALENALEHLESARSSLATEQETLQKEEIAGVMVAMENITASQSLIRDEEGANRVMEQIKDSITKNVNQSMLSQANLHRDHIIRLIG